MGADNPVSFMASRDLYITERQKLMYKETRNDLLGLVTVNAVLIILSLPVLGPELLSNRPQ
jgi:hypothetical protein|tara:strand:+ start:142 stop:324 length:183 start_codon:yes stop_codon:yes gene_type:complete